MKAINKPTIKTLIQVIIILLCDITAYGIFVFLFGALPQFFNIGLSKTYLCVILALVFLMKIPIILFFARKYNLNLKNEKYTIKLSEFSVLIIISCLVSFYFGPIFHDPSAFFMGMTKGDITIQVLSFTGFDAEIAIFWISGLLFAPILEELLFRGLIFNQLKKSFSIRNAILISSLLFALMHLDFTFMGLSYFLWGILLCISYYKTGSLFVPMVLHSLINILFNVTKVQTIEVNPMPFVLYIVSFIISVVVLCYLLRFPFSKPKVDKL
jgi:hypothetical protein